MDKIAENFSRSLKEKLSQLTHVDLTSEAPNKACVAILTTFSQQGLELAYIRRSTSDKDPWSGHIAFPGGKSDFGETDFATVQREVQEEIGLHLNENSLLGKMSDLQARRATGRLPMFLRPFVFSVEKPTALKLDTHEVADFHWIPVRYILDPQNHVDHEIIWNSTRVKFPGLAMGNGLPLWGLTYILTCEFLKILSTLPTDLLETCGLQLPSLEVLLRRSYQ